MKAVLVTGGRDYDQFATVSRELDMERPDMLIHGNAPGADRMAARWAQVSYVSVAAFPADWGRYGLAAGPIRNTEMVRHASELKHSGWDVLVLAFPGGKGTENCVTTARQAGLTVREVPA